MTITSYGYGGDGGSIDEVAWAKMAPHMGAQPHVVTGCGITVTSAVNRTVAVAAGELSGNGIYDVAAGTTLTLATQAGTTPRWDAIVAHRDWQATPNGLTTLTAVTGVVGAAPVTPPTLAVTPGVAADQIIGWVPVTSTGAGTPTMQPGPFAPGSLLYWAATTIDPNPADFPYGQTLIQPQAAGNRLLIRTGTSTPAFEDMLNPPWVEATPRAAFVSQNTDRRLRLRVRGGRLEVRGELKLASGGNLVPGGGSGAYGLCDVPTSMQPTDSRFFGTTSDTANVRIWYDASTAVLRASVFTDQCTYLFLDGVSFPL